MIPRGRQNGKTFHWRGLRVPEHERTTRTFEPISDEAKARFRQVLAEREARNKAVEEAPAVPEQPAIDEKKEATVRYNSLADVLTKEVVTGWHAEYMAGRSIADISQNNGIEPVSENTVRKYFKLYSLPVGVKAGKRPQRKKPEKPGDLVPAAKNGHSQVVATELTAPIYDRVRQAQEQLEQLRDVGELEVKAVTLNFDLKISV